MPLNLSQRLLLYISHFDLFSSKITFKFQNKNEFSTMLGGILSILILSTAIILTIGNSTLWETHILYTQTDQILSNLTYYATGLTFPMGVSFLHPSNNSVINLGLNVTVSYYCVSFPGTYSNGIPLGVTYNCQRGNFCLPQTQLTKCRIDANYLKLSKTGLMVVISKCNSTLPTCKINYLKQIYPDNIIPFAWTFDQIKPNDNGIGLKKVTVTKIFYANLMAYIQTMAYLTKIRYYQQSNVNLFTWSDSIQTSSLYMDFRDPILNYSGNTQLLYPLVIGRLILCATQRRIVILDATRVDIVAIIIYFTSLLGTFVFLGNICMPNYTANSLNLKIGSKLKYTFREDKKLYNAESFSIQTFIICFFYIKVFQNMQIWCIKRMKWQNGIKIIALIKAGDKCMNITNFLTKLTKINAKKNFKNVTIKAKLKKRNQIQIEDLKEAKQKIMQETDLRNMDDSQKKAFIKLVEINSLEYKEAYKMLDALFPKDGLVQINNPGLRNLFSQFKQVMDSLKDNEKQSDPEKIKQQKAMHTENDKKVNQIRLNEENNNEIIFNTNQMDQTTENMRENQKSPEKTQIRKKKSKLQDLMLKKQKNSNNTNQKLNINKFEHALSNDQLKIINEEELDNQIELV